MRDDGAWSLPFPSVDAQIVLRSAAVLPLDGPAFTYSHSFVVGPLPVVPLAVTGVAVLGVLAQLRPVREGLERLIPAGSGPTTAQRAASRFEVRFVGTGGGRRVVARVAGGDPGYTETSKMLAESAVCLAFDDLPVTTGQVTTAVAMGEALTDRLRRAGIRFEVVEEGPVADDGPGGSCDPMTDPDREVVRYEVADRIAVVTLNRPEARNAMSAGLRRGLWPRMLRGRGGTTTSTSSCSPAPIRRSAPAST